MSNYHVEFHYTFAHPPELVYRAWTTPEAMRRWFCHTEEFPLQIHEYDLRPGGSYSLTFRLGDQQHRLSGIFQDVIPPELLSYTWQWLSHEEDESLVVVRFRKSASGGTELHLRHERLPHEQAREQTHFGWSNALEKFCAHVNSTTAKNTRAQ